MNASKENFFKKFATKSTFYGIRYLAKPNIPKVAKFIWLAAILTSFFGLIYYAHAIYVKGFHVPNNGVSYKIKSTREVPFPAVTICTPLTARFEYANFSQWSSNFYSLDSKTPPHSSPSEQSYLSAFSQICDQKMSKIYEIVLPERNEDKIVRLIVKLHLMLMKYSWTATLGGIT